MHTNQSTLVANYEKNQIAQQAGKALAAEEKIIMLASEGEHGVTVVESPKAPIIAALEKAKKDIVYETYNSISELRSMRACDLIDMAIDELNK